MSRYVEYVSPAGLRQDGRRPLEHRRVEIEFGVLPECDGSCAMSVGRTRITSGAFGPREPVMRTEARVNEASLTCDVSIAAFSFDDKRLAQRRNKTTDDIANAVVQTLRSIVLLGQYAGSQIHVTVDILKADGSEKAACINAACMALVDAGIAMKDAVFAVTAGTIDQKTLADLTEVELRSQCPHMCLVSMVHDPSAIVWMEMNSRAALSVFEELQSQAQRSVEDTSQSTLIPVLRQHAAKVLAVQNAKVGAS